MSTTCHLFKEAALLVTTDGYKVLQGAHIGRCAGAPNLKRLFWLVLHLGTWDSEFVVFEITQSLQQNLLISHKNVRMVKVYCAFLRDE